MTGMPGQEHAPWGYLKSVISNRVISDQCHRSSVFDPNSDPDPEKPAARAVGLLEGPWNGPGA